MSVRPRASHLYRVRTKDFDAVTREIVARWEQERRQRFAELLAADPLAAWEDLPIGEPLTFRRKEQRP